MRNTPKRPFGAALDKLEQRAAKSKPHRGPLPDAMLPSEIKLLPDVFQPRTIEGAMGEDVDHVRELRRGLEAKGAVGFLDAILVIKIGRANYCVDGHHRLAAYREAKTPYVVPVEWFHGSIREAVVETAKRNSRDRLPMRRPEKWEAAWRMTNLGGYSKAEVSEATTVGLSMIATMRKTMKAILADQEEPDASKWDGTTRGPEPRDMTWDEAKRYGRAEPDRDEDWEIKLAEKWAGQLAQLFGTKWGKMPEVAARAIDRYSEGLSGHLIAYWGDEAREVVAALDED